MEFKDRIKALRREKGMSQAQLAAMLNKSEGAIRAWEIERSKPDIDTLMTLSKFFDCTTDYLLGLDDHRNEKQKSDIEALRSFLDETIPKIPEEKGKDLIQALKYFLDFTDMEGYEKAIFNFLKTSELFLSHFNDMQKIRDEFNQSQTFNLSKYIDFVTSISAASAVASRLMHIISTIPIWSLLHQTAEYSVGDNYDLAYKIYLAYYDRFMYESPANPLQGFTM